MIRNLATAMILPAAECARDSSGSFQVVVNYASSSGAAEEVAEQIKQLGGDAVTVQADLGQAKDIQK